MPHLDLDIPFYLVVDLESNNSPQEMRSLRELIQNYTKPEYVVIAPADLPDLKRCKPVERKFSNNSHNLRVELKNFDRNEE